MVNYILLYSGAALPILWGISHLFPTRSIVSEFGDITLDNKRIITMEWIIEGVVLIFIGVIVAAVTYIDYTHRISRVIYWLSFLMLNTLSVISFRTIFKINFLPYKLQPIIFTSSSSLIMIGCYFYS
ncbi:MAG: hypothetical protein JW837_01025 [Sedimentisphaerales bacterium]|nr:hypothetical protein [Sedimentisphaerales bacterium]